MTQQEIMADWKAWLIEQGLSGDTADRLIALGPSALEYLLLAALW